MLWGEFLKMLEADGVTLESSEYDALTADGERYTRWFLFRFVEGRPLRYDIDPPDLARPVSRWMIRRIANQLRLPYEKYIKPF